jgi:hypothetical protein
MSVCRGARDLTFQYPCSYRFPPLREGNRDLVPPAGRGEPKGGGLQKLSCNEPYTGRYCDSLLACGEGWGGSAKSLFFNGLSAG